MKIGSIAFLAGLAVAVIGGFINVSWFPLLLVVIGLLVGLLNVSGSETKAFLIACIAFLMATTAIYPLEQALNNFAGLGTIIGSIMHNIGYMVGAATLIVAIKALFEMSKD
ncbi:hypothetical protein [Kangiella taiwanensis]|uniref:Uncharacterized protein n=1 Tax=Kangiella taiwanensis TaxID=1079179 RepID=A0ABP8HUC4_9GAMM|nr:hypothetical protein [Kangiella taiwanensis]